MSWGAPGVGNGTGHGVRAVLTVLFTDIEASTALTERLGDERWVDVLSAHDVAVRTALAAHRGDEVKTVGDGFLVVFERAADAVRAAVLVQRLVRTVRVPEVPGGLRVRIGAHAGPVIRRNGDVLGRNVHVARRITSAARGGEVLVSASVKALVGGAVGLGSGPSRRLRLAGVGEPQVVFEMTGEAATGADLHVLDLRRARPVAVPAAAR